MSGSRRSFLKQAAATAAAGAMAVRASGGATRPRVQVSGSDGRTSIDVRDGRLQIETRTLTAIFDKGLIASLKSKATGEEFIGGHSPDTRPLQLLYRGGESVAVDESRFGSIASRKVSDRRAEVLVHSWDADGLLGISIDAESGDVIVEPSAFSSRPGVRACRWTIGGIRPDLSLVAPLFQGIKLKLDDALLRGSRWTWPQAWEAGFAVLQGPAGGFWVHTQAVDSLSEGKV